MNEKQRIVELLKEHHKEYGRNKMYYNIAYTLIMSYAFTDSLKKVDNMSIFLLVDNLWINNVMIDKYDMNGYDPEYLTERLGKRTITKINNDSNLFVLLNFYDINNKLIQCKKVYKYDYNILGL